MTPFTSKYQPLRLEDFAVGSFLLYNDGREAHTNVRCEVLESDDRGMVVQFEDRMSTTRISYNDREWMEHITCAS